MKKLMMLSAVCLLTLSSFEMSAKNKVEKAVVPPPLYTVYYTCGSSTTLKSFLTTSSNIDNQQTTASAICGTTVATIWKPVQ